MEPEAAAGPVVTECMVEATVASWYAWMGVTVVVISAWCIRGCVRAHVELQDTADDYLCCTAKALAAICTVACVVSGVVAGVCAEQSLRHWAADSRGETCAEDGDE